MKIILIAGKKRSGKDFFADELKQQLESLNKKCEIIHFADPLKNILCTALNISRDSLEYYKDKESVICFNTKLKNKAFECKPTVNMRTLLQKFGTDAMQNTFGKEVWKNLVLKQIETFDCDYVLIPDFRFLHEYIPNTVSILITGGNKTDRHISENGLTNFSFNYIIDNNNKDIFKLKEQVSQIVERLNYE